MQDTPETPDPEGGVGDAPAPRGRLAKTVRTLAIDVSPLRESRDYRLLWFGELISEAGHPITVGPAIGGIVIARLGLPWAYGIDLVTYGATIAAAMLMHPMRPLAEEGGATRGMAAIREGLAYLKGRRVLQSTFYIDIIAMVF